MMSRNEKKRKVKSKRIVAAGIVSLTVVLTASAGISYADMDVAVQWLLGLTRKPSKSSKAWINP